MSINNLRQRITSAYPSWSRWSQLQKKLLLLRSTHGEFWQKDAMDNTANILITEQYDRLKEIAKIFDVDRGDIGKAIKAIIKPKNTSFLFILTSSKRVTI